jgi:hypothetical protein
LVVSTIGAAFAGLERKVHANLLSDLQQNVLALHCLESFGLGANRVRSRKEVGSVVFPGVACDQSAGNASLHILDGDRGAGNDAAALVRNRSRDAAKIAL